MTNAEINITNYSISRQDRTDKTGGGTAIYVRSGIPYRSRTDLQKNGIETCWIEIIRPNTKSLFVSSVYRPPDANVDNFIENLNNAISIIQENAEMILLGQRVETTKRDHFSQKSVRCCRDDSSWAPCS